MRFVATLFLIVLLASSSHAQGKTFGKSPAQIAAMGLEKWSNFYAAREGAGTGTSADAAEVFGKSLRQVNDKRIEAAHLSVSERESLEALRKAAYDFTSGMLEIAARDGGTMWVPMRASRQAGVEELIAHVLARMRGESPAVPARRQKIQTLTRKIEAGLQKAQRDLADAAEDLPKDQDFKGDLQKARAAFAVVQKRFVREQWPGSVTILEWFAARAEP